MSVVRSNHEQCYQCCVIICLSRARGFKQVELASYRLFLRWTVGGRSTGGWGETRLPRVVPVPTWSTV